MIRHLLWSEKVMLLYVFTVLSLVKVLLMLFPFNWFLLPKDNLTFRKPRKGMGQADMYYRSWAIKKLSATIPLGFTCLVQALAAKWLLKNQSDIWIHIGVRKNSADGFSAHAWVTYQQTIILGDQSNVQYEPILVGN